MTDTANPLDTKPLDKLLREFPDGKFRDELRAESWKDGQE